MEDSDNMQLLRNIANLAWDARPAELADATKLLYGERRVANDIWIGTLVAWGEEPGVVILSVELDLSNPKECRPSYAVSLIDPLAAAWAKSAKNDLDRRMRQHLDNKRQAAQIIERVKSR